MPDLGSALKRKLMRSYTESFVLRTNTHAKEDLRVFVPRSVSTVVSHARARTTESVAPTAKKLGTLVFVFYILTQ